jgi:hypothetical protein
LVAIVVNTVVANLRFGYAGGDIIADPVFIGPFTVRISIAGCFICMTGTAACLTTGIAVAAGITTINQIRSVAVLIHPITGDFSLRLATADWVIVAAGVTTINQIRSVAVLINVVAGNFRLGRAAAATGLIRAEIAVILA